MDDACEQGSKHGMLAVPGYLHLHVHVELHLQVYICLFIWM